MTQIDAGRHEATRGQHTQGRADEQRPGPTSRGSPEGRYAGGPGKPLCRQVTELQEREAIAVADVGGSQDGVERAERTDQQLKDTHRGGDRAWPLRSAVPLGVLAEAVTAYIATAALVASVLLAGALSTLTALIGCGLACLVANRRLNRLPVPTVARILEGIFVAILTALRYESLHILGADFLAAAGGTALAAVISALVLLGIEEIIVETRTLKVFLSSLRVSWRHWRHAAAVRRLAKIQARSEAAGRKLQHHFREFLLKTEGIPLGEAQRRATALKAALTGREA
jgi:hypothetical protein